jgi:hypothetical protein
MENPNFTSGIKALLFPVYMLDDAIISRPISGNPTGG